jgi:hypothetical protein
MMKMPFDGRKEKEGNGLISCDAVTQITLLEFVLESVHFIELTIMLVSISCLFYGFQAAARMITGFWSQSDGQNLPSPPH